MVLSEPSRQAPSDAFPGGAAAARLLADGTLGGRLLRAAQVAAALHMAEFARPRNEGAQVVPREDRA